MSICSSSKAMKLWPPHSLGETEQKEVGSSHLLKVWTSLLQGYSLLQQRGSATFLVLHSQQGQHSIHMQWYLQGLPVLISVEDYDRGGKNDNAHASAM